MLLPNNTHSTPKQKNAFLKDYLYQAVIANDLLPLAWLDESRLFLFANASFCKIFNIHADSAWNQLHVRSLPSPACIILQEIINHVVNTEKTTFEFYTKKDRETSSSIKVVKFGNAAQLDGVMITVVAGISNAKPEQVQVPAVMETPKTPEFGDTLLGTQLASLLSHDLREPLRTIGNFSHLLAKRCSARLDDAGKEYLQFVRSGVAQLDSLFDDMLDMVKQDETSPYREDIQLADLKTILSASYRGYLSNIGGQLTFRTKLQSFRACPKKILPLFSHLIDNALKFRSPERPPVIAIKFTENKTFWCIEVADNGIGIPEEYRKKIFEPFKRLHNRSNYPGNGAGLAICKKIVEQHGGTIWATANSSPGSCFHFTLKK